MMGIMDRLTDKENWHKKVFDEAIVAKWRKEALEIPDETWWSLAFQEKRQWWDADDNLFLRDDWSKEGVPELQGIMTDGTFDCVSDLATTDSL
jgi:hypothetical protein